MSRRILVMPAYNEARTIVGVLNEAEALVDRIVVVNDGSTDDSPEQIATWAQCRPHVTLLSLPRNQGQSGALLCGFAYVYALVRTGLLAEDDLVITIDADGQHVPSEIPLICEKLIAEEFDVVLGRRSLEGYPWFKHLGNWGLSLWASLLTGYRYRDVECGFRVMRAGVVSDLLTYFLGRRYGCAQEIGIITAAMRRKVDNSFPAGILYYRAGARVRDGVTNLIMGLLAALRVRLSKRFNPDMRALSVLRPVFATVPEEYRALELLAMAGSEMGTAAFDEAGD